MTASGSSKTPEDAYTGRLRGPLARGERPKAHATYPLRGWGAPFGPPKTLNSPRAATIRRLEPTCTRGGDGHFGVDIGRILNAGGRLCPEGAPRRRGEGRRRRRSCHNSHRHGQFDAFCSGVPGLLSGALRFPTAAGRTLSHWEHGEWALRPPAASPRFNGKRPVSRTITQP